MSIDTSGVRRSNFSPATGAASAPVSQENLLHRSSPVAQGRSIVLGQGPFLLGQLTSGPSSSLPSTPTTTAGRSIVFQASSPPAASRRRRAHSLGQTPPIMPSPKSPSGRKIINDAFIKSRAKDAQRVNDSMVYLDGAQVYSCAQCRTHLTSHDDIISKSFHGRHGRAYLFDQCVNVAIGPAEDRVLITGLHSVCDIFCKRCNNLVGWTYQRAYEASQKYKEGKFIIEKINLHLEESDYYDVAPPAGEKTDRWRKRSMSWGSDSVSSMVYEYQPDSGSSTTS